MQMLRQQITKVVEPDVANLEEEEEEARADGKIK